MKRSSILIVALCVTVVAAGAWLLTAPGEPVSWTDTERKQLLGLSLDRLPPPPPDPSNAVADDPAAARFGQRLFFDARFSANGAVSCASCHQPARRFTDGLPRGRGIGLSRRNTMSIVGSAYSPWQYWDGRKDSQWSQALSPLEDPAEHGSNRVAVVRAVFADDDYRERYESLFGPLPDLAHVADAAPVAGSALAERWDELPGELQHRIDRAFSNIGKAIAAYERLLVPGRARFDEYIAAVEAGDEVRQRELFSLQEIRGLRLFIGKARCIECHNGPLLTNNEFHNTGLLSIPGELPDRGRSDGLREVLEDRFNCMGPYSDDPARQCPELEFVRRGPELVGATRTPSLRNLAGTEPYTRRGLMASLPPLLEHYDRAPLAMIGHNEAKELDLGRRELEALHAFLLTLDAPLATDDKWLQAPRD